MQLGQRHRQVAGLAICAVAIGVAVVVPRGDGSKPLPALTGISSVVDGAAGAASGGSLETTVSWPAGSAERFDICVVLYDEVGRVVEESVGGLDPIAGRPVAGHWQVDGLAPGRYTVYAAECVTPGAKSEAWVEPQFLGGGADAEAARWVEVADGDRVDVGTIALHRSGLATWRTRSS